MGCKRTRMPRIVRTIGGAGVALAMALASEEPAATAAPFGVIEGDALDVTAERLDVDVEQGQARLDGAVSLRVGDLEIKCSSVEIRYDRSPRVSWARGKGGVVARLRGVEAIAGVIEFDADARKVDLRGGVRLSRGKGWVTAEHAVIDIASGKVSLEGVKGSIPVDPPRR